MEKKTYYCLDANILIDAWDRTYQIDVCPGYWDILIALGKTGKNVLFTTSDILNEIKGKDDLKKIARDNLNSEMAKDIYEKHFPSISEVFDRLKGSSPSRSGDASAPDLSLIALAQLLDERHNPSPDSAPLLNNKVKVLVVSNEVKAGEAAHKINIPNICKEIKLGCIFGSEFLSEASKGYRYRLIFSKDDAQSK